MSKENKGKGGGTKTVERVKRPKTQAQLARKARNEQDYAARLLAHKAEQERFNALRAEHGALSDEQCRDLLAEQAARKDLDLLLACDMLVGGEPFSKRLMRFVGKNTLKGVAQGNVAVRAIIAACWNYASTQHAAITPVEE